MSGILSAKKRSLGYGEDNIKRTSINHGNLFLREGKLKQNACALIRFINFKTEAATAYETLVPCYQSTWRHIPEECNLH